MFQTEKDYPFVDLDTVPAPEYIIKPGDRIQFQAYTNIGFNQIQTVVPTFEGGGGASGTAGTGTINKGYLVTTDGMIKLPIVGSFQIAGLSVPQAEDSLEQRVKVYYKDPVVTLNVTNRKIYVYTGSSGTATVLDLEEENVTLFEAITMAGGIVEQGKAYQVKVVRGPLSDPQIALYDLSTVEGMKKADIIIQPDDIIYVEPTTRFAAGLLKELGPYLGLLSAITSMVSLILIYSRTSNGN